MCRRNGETVVAELTTKIQGYAITLDTDMNGDGEVTGCWIAHGRFSASLACLEGTGVLTHSDSHTEHQVPAWVIGEIEKWAEANGY